METKVKQKVRKVVKDINNTANRVNKGIVTEFNNGTKWIEFNSFKFDGSHVIYNLEEYEEYLLDTDKDINSITTMSYEGYHLLRRSVGISKEYCVEPK